MCAVCRTNPVRVGSDQRLGKSFMFGTVSTVLGSIQPSLIHVSPTGFPRDQFVMEDWATGLDLGQEAADPPSWSTHVTSTNDCVGCGL